MVGGLATVGHGHGPPSAPPPPSVRPVLDDARGASPPSPTCHEKRPEPYRWSPWDIENTVFQHFGPPPRYSPRFHHVSHHALSTRRSSGLAFSENQLSHPISGTENQSVHGRIRGSIATLATIDRPQDTRWMSVHFHALGGRIVAGRYDITRGKPGSTGTTGE